MKPERPWDASVECNILAVYERASPEDRAEGMHWYTRAYQDVETLRARCLVSISHSQAAGVVAALSPGRTWGGNLLDADALMAAWARGHRLPMVGTYGERNVIKAGRILNGEAPLTVLPVTGPKVRAFYRLLCEPESEYTVCIDRHAKGVAENSPTRDDASTLVRPAEYPWYAWHYRVVAGWLDILPCQLQAVTWTTWRREASTRHGRPLGDEPAWITEGT